MPKHKKEIKERAAKDGEDCLHDVRYIHANSREVGIAISPSERANIGARTDEGGDVHGMLVSLGE
jgi:hypothetical protein